MKKIMMISKKIGEQIEKFKQYENYTIQQRNTKKIKSVFHEKILKIGEKK